MPPLRKEAFLFLHLFVFLSIPTCWARGGRPGGGGGGGEDSCHEMSVCTHFAEVDKSLYQAEGAPEGDFSACKYGQDAANGSCETECDEPAPNVCTCVSEEAAIEGQEKDKLIIMIIGGAFAAAGVCVLGCTCVSCIMRKASCRVTIGLSIFALVFVGAGAGLVYLSTLKDVTGYWNGCGEEYFRDEITDARENNNV